MKPAKQSAENAYASAVVAASEMASHISDLIADLPAPGTQSINWAHVGTINELNAKLAAVVALLEGTER